MLPDAKVLMMIPNTPMSRFRPEELMLWIGQSVSGRKSIENMFSGVKEECLSQILVQ